MSTDSYIHKVLPGTPDGPLLFVFHGTGGDENQLPSLGRDLVPGATIVSPRGDVSEFGAARFFRRTGEGVYDMDDLARAATKMAISNAPTANKVSPGTRIQINRWISGRSMNSAERANQ